MFLLTIASAIFIIVTILILHSYSISLAEMIEAARLNENAFLLSLIGLGALITMLGLLFVLLFRKNKAQKITVHELFMRNEWLDNIMLSLGDGLIATDSKGIITMINQSASSITGWKPQEAKGKYIDEVFEITDEYTGCKVISPAMEALQRNKIVPLANHTFLKQKDGKTLFIDDSGAPIHNEKGEMIGAVLLFRDVSDRKKTEKALLDFNEENKVVAAHIDITQRMLAEQANEINEIKYRRLFESAKDGILILNASTGEIEDVNPYLMQILGFSYRDFIRKELWEIGLFKDKEASKRAFTELQEQEYIRYENLPLRTKAGKRLNVEFVSNVYLVNDRKVIQCNIRDITARRAAEENLRKSEIRLKEAQAISHTANWEIDLMTNENSWSDQFYEIFEFEIGSIQPSQEAFLSLIHSSDRLRVEQGIYKAFETFTNSSLEFRFTGKDGSIRFGYTKWQFEFNKNNVPLRLYGILQDRTEQKRVEERLEQQNLELKKTNSELDRFVYSTSHDLRAPLTSVLGLINIIDENVAPAETDQKERIGMMKQSIAKLDSFIEDIMSYSRNSRMEIEKDEIDFEELINESRQILKYMETDSRSKIQVDVVQQGKFISDRSRILIAINNLISNAIKYQDKAEPNPQINIAVHSDSLKAILTIEDNGIGIPEEKQEKIFDMFFRATKLSKGSGLGLYIAKETMTKLNGTITMKSNQSRGTLFTLTIPNLLEKTN